MSYATEIYQKISDLFNLTTCSETTSSSALCSRNNMAQSNITDIKSISENQFYNDLSHLEIDRLNCSREKAKSLLKNENLTELKNKMNELNPIIQDLQKKIGSEVAKNQMLNGQIPKGAPIRSGSKEELRKKEYDDRNEEVKSMMALKEMLISQIPFSESKPIRDLIEDSNSNVSVDDITKALKKLDLSIDNSAQKINSSKNKAGQFDLSNDQKIALGTDEFLISQMLNNNPSSESDIKNLRCSAEKIKNGQRFTQTAISVASFAIPVGLASAGRLAFLMRAPLLAQKISQISRTAGAACLLLGNINGLENTYLACTKSTDAKIKTTETSNTNQCDYSAQVLVSDFNLSSCIMNATLQLLPNAGGYLAKKMSDKTSLLSKFVFDIKNTSSIKKLSQEEKEIYLKTAGSMTDLERKASTAILADRSLTQVEKAGLIEAHKIAEGKGYFELTESELREKLKKLRSSGFSNDESDLILRAGLAGQTGPYKKVSTISEVVQGLPDSANRSRLLAELKSNSVKPDIETSTDLFKKSTNQYMEQFKAQKSAPSARELSEIEYVSARWASQAKDKDEIAKAQKIYLEAFEKRLRTDKPQGQGTGVQDYINLIRDDGGKGLHKEASQWKIKTIIQYYNSKGWNLR